MWVAVINERGRTYVLPEQGPGNRRQTIGRFSSKIVETSGRCSADKPQTHYSVRLLPMVFLGKFSDERTIFRQAKI